MPTREERIRERLQQALQPAEMELIDDSARHAGHAGARTGMSHYRLRIRAQCFSGHSPLVRHRMVYDALGDMMQTDIHALTIDAAPPDTA